MARRQTIAGALSLIAFFIVSTIITNTNVAIVSPSITYPYEGFPSVEIRMGGANVLTLGEKDSIPSEVITVTLNM